MYVCLLAIWTDCSCFCAENYLIFGMHEMKNKKKNLVNQKNSEKSPHAVCTQNQMNAQNNDDDTFSLKVFCLFISAWIRFDGNDNGD